MTSSHEHWFDIEQVVAEIHALLEGARSQVPAGTEPAMAMAVVGEPGASGLTEPRERRSDSTSTSRRSSSADMQSDGLEPLFGRPLEPFEAAGGSGSLGSDSFGYRGEHGPGLASPEREPASDIAGLRSRIRERLTWLRSRLGDGLSPREAYSVLFPLVIHVDELTAVALGARASDWRQLQTEFFDIDDGGEQFFQRIDELLGKDDTHPLVFEVYYFCLVDGFVGRFGASPSKLEDYRARLASQIPTAIPPVSMDRDEANEVRLVEFPRRYYLISAGAVLVVFVLLHLLTALEARLQ